MSQSKYLDNKKHKTEEDKQEVYREQILKETEHIFKVRAYETRYHNTIMLDFEDTREDTSDYIEKLPKQWLFPAHKVFVCIIGFNKSHNFKLLIDKLGGTFCEPSDERINLLIASTAASDAFYQAYWNPKIKVATKEWANDSHKISKFVNPSEYPVPAFSGIQFFHPFQDLELDRIILENRGEVINSFPTQVDKMLIIVLYQDRSGKYIEQQIKWLWKHFKIIEDYYRARLIRVVEKDWVKHYLRKNLKGADKTEIRRDFVNFYNQDLHKPSSQTNKGEKFESLKIPIVLSDSEEKPQKSNVRKIENIRYMDDVKLYIYDEYEEDVEDHILQIAGIMNIEIIKKFDLNQITHILTQKIDMKLYKISQSESEKPYIVKYSWLQKSLKKEKKYPESKCFPKKMTEDVRSLIESNNSESLVDIISNLFKDCEFIINEDSYNQAEVNDIKSKILKHSGKISTEDNYSRDMVYYISNDGIQRYAFAYSKSKSGFYTVSHRFIDECIKLERIVEISQKTAYLSIMPFSTPNPKFRDINIYLHVNGDQYDTYFRLASICKMRCDDSSRNFTHILVPKSNCSNNDQLKNRIKDILNICKGSSPKVVNGLWFRDCIVSNSLVNEDDYLIDFDKPSK